MPMPMTILLDSNVWRYIVDANATAKVLQAALKSSHRIAIAPAVVYEALRTENPAIPTRASVCNDSIALEAVNARGLL